MPVRILYVHNSADIYGASRSLVRLLRVLDRKRFTPIVLLPAEGPLCEQIRALKVDVMIYPPLSVIDRAVFHSWRLPFFFLNIPRSVLQLRRLLKRYRFDLVHTNTGVILSPGPAAYLAGVPHVWHIRDWFQEFRKFWRCYEAYIHKFSDRVITVSGPIAAQFQDQSDVRVIHNGFDTHEFQLPEPGARDKFRAAHGLATEDVVIGCVGRIKLVRKGQEVLLQAAGLLKERGMHVKILIVGAPYPGNESHLEELQAITRQRNLDVVFTGELSDVRQAYAAMDIFVLPSAQPEPFGGVVMEAMCMGLPVIATGIGGSIEQVDDGKTGFLVPPQDPSALADKLAILARDATLRARFGRAARQCIEERFALKEMAGKIESIYDECLT